MNCRCARRENELKLFVLCATPTPTSNPRAPTMTDGRMTYGRVDGWMDGVAPKSASHRVPEQGQSMGRAMPGGRVEGGTRRSVTFTANCFIADPSSSETLDTSGKRRREGRRREEGCSRQRGCTLAEAGQQRRAGAESRVTESETESERASENPSLSLSLAVSPQPIPIPR